MGKRVSDWLTLGQASELLGIHPTTLRAWADSGQLHAFLTPGGHRRFQLTELKEFIRDHGSSVPQPQSEFNSERTLSLVRQRLGPSAIQEQGWYRELRDKDRSFHRDTGRRLLALLLMFIGQNIASAQLLAQARELGHAYGVGFRRSNLPVSEVARAFVLFRRMIADATVGSPGAVFAVESSKYEVEARINQFMDELLIAILTGYESGPKLKPSTSYPAQQKTTSPRGKSRRLARV